MPPPHGAWVTEAPWDAGVTDRAALPQISVEKRIGSQVEFEITK